MNIPLETPADADWNGNGAALCLCIGSGFGRVLAQLRKVSHPIGAA